MDQILIFNFNSAKVSQPKGGNFTKLCIRVTYFTVIKNDLNQG